MKRRILRLQFFSLLFFATLASAQIATSSQHVRFRVSLSPDLGNEAAEGRLIILLSTQKETARTIEPEMGLHDFKVWITAGEVTHLAPGSSVELDPDVLAYPEPWSHAPVGDYQVMAVLDVNHHYAYNGLDAGDLRSAVVPLKQFNPASQQTIDLSLN